MMSYGKVLFASLLLSQSCSVLAQTTTQPKWMKIGTNGEFGYAVDLNSVSRSNYTGGDAHAVICIVLNNDCKISNLIRWSFDCRGHYRAIDGSGKGMVEVPPNSVPSQVADIVCARAEAPKPDSMNNEATAQQSYRSRYFLAGVLLRAGTVCNDESKLTIATAFRLLDSTELRMVSAAYPAMTKKWMEEGAETFNTATMENGIISACARAAKKLARKPQKL